MGNIYYLPTDVAQQVMGRGHRSAHPLLPKIKSSALSGSLMQLRFQALPKLKHKQDKACLENIHLFDVSPPHPFI